MENGKLLSLPGTAGAPQPQAIAQILAFPDGQVTITPLAPIPKKQMVKVLLGLAAAITDSIDESLIQTAQVVPPAPPVV